MGEEVVLPWRMLGAESWEDHLLVAEQIVPEEDLEEVPLASGQVLQVTVQTEEEASDQELAVFGQLLGDPNSCWTFGKEVAGKWRIIFNIRDQKYFKARDKPDRFMW